MRVTRRGRTTSIQLLLAILTTVLISYRELANRLSLLSGHAFEVHRENVDRRYAVYGAATIELPYAEQEPLPRCGRVLDPVRCGTVDSLDAANLRHELRDLADAATDVRRQTITPQPAVIDSTECHRLQILTSERCQIGPGLHSVSDVVGRQTPNGTHARE